METLGRRPFRKENPTGNESRGRPTPVQPRQATAREGYVSRTDAQSSFLQGKRRLGKLPDEIRFGGANPWSTFPARHARSFDSSIRPSWSCGQPVLHHDFNSGHPFAKLADFRPDLVNFSLEKSEIFAHVAAEVTDLAAKA